MLEYDEGSSEDEYFDRTQKKNKYQESTINLEEKKKYQNKTTENYWQLKERLEKCLTQRHDYNLELINLSTATTKVADDEDELEVFMKSNQQQVTNENREILVQKIKQVNMDIEEYNFI